MPGKKLLVKVPPFYKLSRHYFIRLVEYDRIIEHMVFMLDNHNGRTDSLKFAFRKIGLKLFFNLTNLSFSIFSKQVPIKSYCFLIKSSPNLQSVAIKCYERNIRVQYLCQAVAESQVDVLKLVYTKRDPISTKLFYFLAKLQLKLRYLILDDIRKVGMVKLFQSQCDIANRQDNETSHYLQVTSKARIHELRENVIDPKLLANIFVQDFIPYYLSSLVNNFNEQFYLVT